MLDWSTLIGVACCGLGVVVFLKAVANELERVELSIRQLEQAQKTAQKKRLAAASQERIAQAIAA